MNAYEDELRNYEEEAESRYDDYEEDGYEDEYEYDDDYDDEFDTGLEGRDSYDDDYDEIEYVTDYDGYDGTTIGRIDPNDRTLTISITNTSGVEAQAIVFGGNENAAQPAGVTVTVGESSHNEVREESKANPFKIQGMKMSVSDVLQFDKVLHIVRRTATGANSERVYQPRNATSPQNFSPQLIDDASFEMDVTGQDSLRLLIRAGATVGFTFTIKARANMGNLLKGSNVAELSTAPRTTGLPQIDLMRSRPIPTALEGGQSKVVRKVRKVRRKKAGKVAKSVLMPHTNVKKMFKRKRKKRR
jgi:hypothetical protein